MYEELYAAGNAKASQQSSKVESKKRAQRDASASSTASTSNDRRGGQSSSQKGGRLSYENKHHALLSHKKEGKLIRAILENRYHSSGRSVTGTCIINGSEPLSMHPTVAKHGNSEVKCSRLYNPKGSLAKTMVYSKLFKDGAVRPNQFNSYCEQCHEYHLVHTQESQRIFFVTENHELANGSRSHSGDLYGPPPKSWNHSKSDGPHQIH